MELLSLSVLVNKTTSRLKALPMSPSVAPHAAVITRQNAPAVVTAATVPGGRHFVPSTPSVVKTRKQHERSVMQPEVSIDEVESQGPLLATEGAQGGSN